MQKKAKKKSQLGEVEQFEKDFGSIELLKAIISILSKSLIKKGVLSKKKLKARLEKELLRRKIELVDDD